MPPSVEAPPSPGAPPGPWKNGHTWGGGRCLALVCHGTGTRGGARGLPLGSPLPWAGRGNTHSGGLPRRPGTSLLSPTRWRPQVTVQGRVGLTCPVPRLSPGSRPPRRDKPFPGPFLLPVPSPALSRPPPLWHLSSSPRPPRLCSHSPSTCPPLPVTFCSPAHAPGPPAGAYGATGGSGPWLPSGSLPFSPEWPRAASEPPESTSPLLRPRPCPAWLCPGGT